MTPSFLTTAQLAKRWAMHQVTLRTWRSRGQGPAYHKQSSRKVLYLLADVESWESAHRTEPESKA